MKRVEEFKYNLLLILNEVMKLYAKKEKVFKYNLLLILNGMAWNDAANERII